MSTFTARTIDPPTVTLSVYPQSVPEDGSTNLTYTFARNPSSASALTVNYTIGGSASSNDYTGTTPGTGKTITIPANSATATLTINPTTDTIVEAEETVILNLVSGTGYSVSTASPVTGKITNDDTSTFSISDASVNEGNSGTTSANFSVSLSKAADTQATVQYATQDSTAQSADNDYSAIAPSGANPKCDNKTENDRK